MADDVNVRVAVPEPFTLPGEMTHIVLVTPDVTEQLSVTLEANPLSADTVIVSVLDAPRAKLMLEVAAESWKSGVLDGAWPDSSFTKLMTLSEPSPVTWS